MFSTLLILIPVFALILAGYLCRRRDMLGPHATAEINRFVVWLALPALLFDIMANTSWEALYQPTFFIVFMSANLFVFITVLAWQRLRGKHLADAGIDAMAAAYPNVGFIGFPLLLVIFGKSSLLPTTLATIIVACIMFAIGIALIEASLQVERQPAILLRKVANAVFRNPLIIAPILGLACSLGGLAMPASAEQFLKLLGAAASPCALVCLGLFLADQSGKPAGHARSQSPTQHPAYAAIPGVPTPGSAATAISMVKLVAQPLLTCLFAILLGLPADLRHMAVLLAALPTGTGPFMLAQYYGRDGRLASRAILLTSIASIFSLTLLMTWMGIVP